MSFFDTFNLSTSTLRKFVNKLDALEHFLANKETANRFFERFPFEKFVNISVMDNESFMLAMEMLHFFIKYEQFFCTDAYHYTLELILVNLALCKQDCFETTCLLDLLSKIMPRDLAPIENSVYKERTISVLNELLKNEDFNPNNLGYCSDIVKSWLKMEEIIPPILTPLIALLFNKLKSCNDIREMCTLSQWILAKSNCIQEVFETMVQWLTLEVLPLLNEFQDESLLVDLLKLLNIYLVNSDHMNSSSELINFRKNLIKVSGSLCILSCKSSLRTYCLTLLQLALVQFMNEEKLLPPSDNIDQDLVLLPEDVAAWLKADVDIVFYLCHMLIIHSTSLWKRLDILESIVRCYYGQKFRSMAVFKSLLFLYPALKNDFDTEHHIKILGDDLLNYFTDVCDNPHFYSYRQIQLKWVLKNGPQILKIKILTHWLTNTDNDDLIIANIQENKAEVNLINIILDNKNDEVSTRRAALILRRIANYSISIKITPFLLQTLNFPTVFRNLLFSNPGVPTDFRESMLICSFMGAVLPTLHDVDTLKGACVFTTKILSSLKDRPESVKEFCKNISNIRSLIRINENVDDETSIEIIRLLKIVLRIQNFHNINLETTIEEDFACLLSRSPAKIIKGMELLCYVLSFKQSFLTISPENLYKIYYKLIDFSTDPSLKILAFNSTLLCWKKNPHWTQTIDSVVHLKMSCLQICDAKTTPSLLKMVRFWMWTLQGYPYNSLQIIPDNTIQSFLKRVSIYDSKALENLKILDYLMEKQRSWMKKIQSD